MPGLDGTGPGGAGPLTGWGMGLCILKLPPPAQAGSKTDTNTASKRNRKEVTAMPGGDRTGPMGYGPMTGRAAGFCAGYPVPGYMNPAGRGLWGRGMGMGMGRGRGGWGRRNWFYATGLTGWQRAGLGAPAYAAPGAGGYPPAYAAPAAPPTTQQELDYLKGQAEYFEDALEGIRQRINELGPQDQGPPKNK